MTSIEWCDESWNPLRGCTRISPGCQNCYAERMAARFSGPGMPYEGLARMTEHGPRWTGEIRLLPEELDKPLHWKKPRLVFVNSMSDLFHEKVPFDFVDQVFATMALAPQHTFQVLTKRADRMLEYFNRPVEHWNEPILSWRLKPGAWPLPNVWLGTSVENQEYADKRVPYLLQTPAAVRFLSCEPLLGALDIREYLPQPIYICQKCGEEADDSERDTHGRHGYCGGTLDQDGSTEGVDWVIVGAESGPGARPMDEDWVRSLRDQCQAAGTSFFYKQRIDERGHKVPLPELDGHQWTEMPTSSRTEAPTNG